MDPTDAECGAIFTMQKMIAPVVLVLLAIFLVWQPLAGGDVIDPFRQTQPTTPETEMVPADRQEEADGPLVLAWPPHEIHFGMDLSIGLRVSRIQPIALAFGFVIGARHGPYNHGKTWAVEGLILDGDIGIGGWKLGAGWGIIERAGGSSWTGLNARFSLYRSDYQPIGIRAHQTYLGVEGEYRFFFLGFTLGGFWHTGQSDPEPRTIFNFGISVWS